MSKTVSALKAAAASWLTGVYRRTRLRWRGQEQLCRVRRTSIKLGVSSEIEHFRADTYATKEPETLDWLDQNLRDRDVYIDIGANIGVYALYAAKIRPLSRIFAFEPAAQNFSRLCQNIALNAAGNIMPCNVALSDKDGFELFYISDLQAGSAFHSLGGFNDGQPEKNGTRLVQGVMAARLDSLIASRQLAQPALLKIDVDGDEEKILAGADAALKSPVLRSVLIEITHDGRSESPIVRKLEGLGFICYARSLRKLPPGPLESQNYLFRRESGTRQGARS